MGKIQSVLYSDIEKSAEQEMTDSKPIYDNQSREVTLEMCNLIAAFFWGEGTFGIEASYNGKSFNPSCNIWLRDDDILILREFKERFGGRFQPHPKPSGGGKPQVAWEINVAEDQLRIGKILTRSLDLPFRKKKAFIPWFKAVCLKHAKMNAGFIRKNPPEYIRDLSQLRKKVHLGNQYVKVL